jgi:hypothetical protein
MSHRRIRPVPVSTAELENSHTGGLRTLRQFGSTGLRETPFVRVCKSRE